MKQNTRPAPERATESRLGEVSDRTEIRSMTTPRPQTNRVIRAVLASDKAEWLRMPMALWRASDSDTQSNEIEHFLADPARSPLPTLQAVFVCTRAVGGLCGLVEIGIRPYADGCETNDVGYLEAWYVDADARKGGIGRALVRAAEGWARTNGCSDMASDAELTNLVSQAAHQRLGYTETGRIVQFCKSLHRVLKR